MLRAVGERNDLVGKMILMPAINSNWTCHVILMLL